MIRTLLLAVLCSGCFPNKTFLCGNDDSRCTAGEKCVFAHLHSVASPAAAAVLRSYFGSSL